MGHPESRHSAATLAAVSATYALPILFAIATLARFYRRFLYRDGETSVWGLADDVYISACFGRSLVSGAGFVWYEGAPRVEGISNPLWSAFIGFLHLLPGFRENRLGLFVLGANAALLVILPVALAKAVARASDAREPLDRAAARWSSAFLFSGAVAVVYWCAEGFEIALLAVLTILLFRLSMAVPSRRRAVGMGLLLSAGFMTRMDSLVLTLPTLLIVVTRHRSRTSQLLWTLAVFLGCAGGSLLLRRIYYGDWLPNTYYLKATGWPLRDRLPRGIRQNAVLLGVATASWLPLAISAVRRALAGAMAVIVAALLGFSASVLYSTYVGGDAWGSFAGYDRHTAIGGFLLVLASAVASSAVRSRKQRVAFVVWGGLLLVVAASGNRGFQQIYQGALATSSPVRQNEWDWIRYGKLFGEISEPGARIAMCPAGAIVYFSHRGGVDLLGKVEPLVAHLDVSPQKSERTACWRNAPGHNKGDDYLIFEARKPEFSRTRPPSPMKGAYSKIKYNSSIFFVRQSHRHLLRPSLR